MMPKNVCVAFLGFDSDRIYLPVKKLKCDKLHLIIKEGKEHDNALFNRKLILDNLKGFDIIEHEMPQDPLLRINCIRKIAEAEKGNRIFINVSTGSKLDAISGMLGAMLFAKDAVLFYAVPEAGSRPGKKKVGYSETHGLRDMEQVPVLPMQQPDPIMLEALSEIKKAGGKMKKKEIIVNLIQKGFLEEFELDKDKKIVRKTDKYEYEKERHRSVQSGAFHVCENKVFKQLKNKWKLIEEDDRTKNKNVLLTEDGKKMVKIFFGEI